MAIHVEQVAILNAALYFRPSSFQEVVAGHPAISAARAATYNVIVLKTKARAPVSPTRGTKPHDESIHFHQRKMSMNT